MISLRYVKCFRSKAGGYTLKQCKFSIKRAVKSEQEKFSKQRPKYVVYVEFRYKQHGHILLASIGLFFFQINFQLVSEYCHTISTRDVGLSNSMAQSMKKMLCVQ